MLLLLLQSSAEAFYSGEVSGSSSAGAVGFSRVASSVATAAGTATSSSAGFSRVVGAGSSTVSSTVSASGRSSSVGSAGVSASSTASSEGRSESPGAANSAGTSTASLTGVARFFATGSSTGQATAQAVGTPPPGTASVSGSSSATATARSRALSTSATANGTSTASAVGLFGGLASATGTSSSTASGFSRGIGTATSTGSAAASASGQPRSTGTGVVNGTSSATVSSTGLRSTGSGSATGTSFASAVGVVQNIDDLPVVVTPQSFFVSDVLETQSASTRFEDPSLAPWIVSNAVWEQGALITAAGSLTWNESLSVFDVEVDCDPSVSLRWRDVTLNSSTITGSGLTARVLVPAQARTRLRMLKSGSRILCYVNGVFAAERSAQGSAAPFELLGPGKVFEVIRRPVVVYGDDPGTVLAQSGAIVRVERPDTLVGSGTIVGFGLTSSIVLAQYQVIPNGVPIRGGIAS